MFLVARGSWRTPKFILFVRNDINHIPKKTLRGLTPKISELQ
jgi:hypothetical protein